MTTTKKQRLEKKRAYYRANKNKAYETHRKWVEKNEKKFREYHKEYNARPEIKERRRKLYQLNIEKYRERDRLHYHKTKQRHSEVYRSRKYGLSIEEYRKLIAKNTCDVCGLIETAKNKTLSIDHCHTTNKVRGLLCNNCNKALGHAHDSVELLDKLRAYLIKNAKTS